MTNCPPTPSATQSLLERIAFIQHTHYGGFWEFTSSSTPTDTAYTNLPLAVHTDTTYLSNPCGLQMFHLLSHTKGTGGESLFVDGYPAAAYLRDRRPLLYNVLSRTKILSHASGNTEVGELDNAACDPLGSPVFGGGQFLSANNFEESGLGHKAEVPDPRKVRLQIRWNNDDRDAQTWGSLCSMEQWYKAAHEWSRILKMKQFVIKLKLSPGQPIIFDNWRYLHGRTRFSGDRRICGGYSKSCIFDLTQLSRFICCHFVRLNLLVPAPSDQHLRIVAWTLRMWRKGILSLAGHSNKVNPVNMDDFLARYRITNFGPRNGLNRAYFYGQKLQRPDKPATYRLV